MKPVYTLLLLSSFVHSAAIAAGPGLPNVSYSQDFEFLEKFDGNDDLSEGQGFVTMHQGYLLMPFSKDAGGGNGTGGFTLYDISDPRNPETTFTTIGNSKYTSSLSADYVGDMREPHGFTISDDNIWCMTMNDSGRAGLQFWDLSDVESANGPERLSEIALPNMSGGDYSETAWWVHWQGRYAYVGGTNEGLYIVDAVDPSNPQYVKRISNANLGSLSKANVVHAVGNLLVVTASDAQGICTLDISDPVNPVLLDSSTESVQYSSIFNGNLLFGAKDPAVIFDLSDPSDITKVGTANDVSGKGGYGVIKDNLFVFGSSNDMVLLDYSNPSSPVVVGVHNPESDASFSGNPDWDFATPLGNLVFQGNDHEGSALVVLDKDPDAKPPAISMVSPVDNALNQNVKSRIGVTVTDQILTETINSSTFVVRKLGGSALTGRYTNQLGMINFSPDQELEADTTYEIWIPAGGLKDFAGNPIATEFRSLFSTGAEIGSPLVVSVSTSAPVEVGNPVTFTASVEGGTNPTFVWDFGDGFSSVPSTGTSATHTYNQNGNFVVKVTVEEGGTSVEASSTQVVYNTPTSSAPTRSSSIVFDADHNLIWIANPDNDTVTAVSNSSLQKVWEIPVGVKPQTLALGNANELWVVNQTSASIVVINRATGTVIDEMLLPHGSRPYGIAFSPDKSAAYVSLEGTGDLLKLNASTGFLLNSIDLNAKIRGIAVSGNGERVYVTRFISSDLYGELFEVNAADLSLVQGHPLHIDTSPDAEDNGRGLPNYLSSVAISPDGREAWVPSKKDNIQRGTARDGLPLTFESTVRSIATRVSLDGSQQLLYSSNQIENGQFELGSTTPDGWELGSLASVVNGSVAFGGSGQAIRLESLGGTSSTSTKQTVTLEPNTDYEVSVWVNAAGLIAGTVVFDSSDVFDPDTVPGGDAQFVIRSANSGWTQYTGRFNSSNLSSVTMRSFTSSTFAGTVYFDNFSIRAVSEAANRVDFNDRGIATGAVYNTFGNYVFVGTSGGNTIEYVDAYSGEHFGSIPSTGRMVRNLAISSDGNRLYAHNFMTRTMDVFDITGFNQSVIEGANRLTTVELVANEKLAADVLAGKQIFYNASDNRMSQDGYISCASCHLDGGQDGRIWDFTDRGEGLRNTISLRGRSGTGHGLLHWSANFDEVQDFEHDIRGPFGGDGFLSDAEFNHMTRNETLGTPKAGVNSDLDNLAAYVASLDTVPESPYRNEDGSLTPAAIRGKAVFNQRACYECHSGPDFSDSQHRVVHDIGTVKASSGQRLNSQLDGIDTPSLLGLWNTAPYLHDGSAETLHDVLTASDAQGYHGEMTQISPSDREDLIQYLLQLDGNEAAPEEAPLVTFENVSDGMLGADGDVFAPVVSVSREAIDVTHVMIYENGVEVGTDTTAPYSSNITISGEHEIGASVNFWDGSSSTLLPRSLVMADAPVVQPDPLDVKINFQPQSSAVPTGYLADTSLLYADRGNGFVYGWTTEFDETRERNVGSEQRIRTLNHLQKSNGDRIWEIELPNGLYSVTAAGGDASHDDGFIHLVAERGTANEIDIVSQSPLGVNVVTGTVEVQVSDGKLTIGSGPQGVNNKICYVDISRVVEPAPTSVRVNFQPSGATVPTGYLKDGSEVFTDRGNGYSYGWDTAFDQTRERNADSDQRLDTLNHMQKNGEDHYWEIALPNSVYRVTVVSGDPSFDDGFMHIVAEAGTSRAKDIVNGSVAGVNFISGTALVTVDDGRLTLSNGASSLQNKICYVDIVPVSTDLPQISMSLSRDVVTEADGGLIALRLELDESVDYDLEVEVLVSGTATDGTDIDAFIGGLYTIPAGDAFIERTFTTVEDGLAEGTEVLGFSLSAGTYELSSPSSVSLEIRDSGFDLWRISNFGRRATRLNADGGEMGDPDQDGIVSLLEYAFAASPNEVDPSAAVPELEFIDGQICISYDRPAGVTDVRYRVFASPDLAGWQDVTDDYTETVQPSGATERVTLEPISEDPGRASWFVKIEVSIE